MLEVGRLWLLSPFCLANPFSLENVLFLKEVVNEGEKRTLRAGVGRENRAKMLRSCAGMKATERDGDVILPSL